MPQQLIKFPHIDALRHVVKAVRDRANYHQVAVPKLTFHGTPKLHGTNASVCRNIVTGETWCQSRETIITPEQDNAGFARFVSEHAAAFNLLFNEYMRNYTTDVIVIYGEWCGKGIMKGVAVSQLEKMFVIFGVKLVQLNVPLSMGGFVDGEGANFESENATWSKYLPAELLLEREMETLSKNSIYDIGEYKSWDININFVNPEDSLEELFKFTAEVEKECPVAKEFGVQGLGEGIVWTCDQTWYAEGHDVRNGIIQTSDLRFKTKGEKHKEAAHEKPTVDVEKVANIKQFVQGVATPHRFEKMIEKLTIARVPLVPESIPQFLKLVGEDVLREEGDVLEASGLDRKDVMKQVNFVARNWFLENYKNAL